MKKLFLVSLLCLAQLFPAALLAQTKKVEIDDDIPSITEANKEKAKLQHEQNVELWKKRFPDYKRVTGFYADLSASLGASVQDVWECNMQWVSYGLYGRGGYYQQVSGKSYIGSKFYWSIDAVIGYRFCPYIAVGAGGGICAGPLNYNNVCGRIYPLSVKSTFLHCGPGSIFAEAKFVLDYFYGVCPGGKLDFGYSFPLGKWLHLNTSFQYSLMGGWYTDSYYIKDGMRFRSYGGYGPSDRSPFTDITTGLLYSYCFRVGLEF